MGKKKTRPAAIQTRQRAARKRMLAAEDVQKAVRMAKDHVDRLAALESDMQKYDLGAVEIDGYGLFERGVDEIDRFIDNVDKGVKKARRDKERSSM